LIVRLVVDVFTSFSQATDNEVLTLGELLLIDIKQHTHVVT